MVYDCASMTARHRHLPARSPAAWLLALGLFAVALHAFAGVGPTRPRVAGRDFHAPICTSIGLAAAPALPQSGQGSDPTGEQSCCQLCAFGAPLLPSDAQIAVPPAPTFSGSFAAVSATRPRNPASVSHPQRGPPLS